MGSLRYSQKPEQLEFSTDLCESPSLFNTTYYEVQKPSNNDIVLLSNDTERSLDQPNNIESFPLMYLYGISYTLYPVIGPLLTILIGLIVSRLTGPANTQETAPELISPIVLKLCCKKFLTKTKSYELKPV
ncbi:UNVERIFIED_CONTAM: hypothetical protein RMT77_010961 [Armadillidium vulgare]